MYQFLSSVTGQDKRQKSMIVAIEGLDGSGKTTLISRLRSRGNYEEIPRLTPLQAEAVKSLRKASADEYAIYDTYLHFLKENLERYISTPGLLLVDRCFAGLYNSHILYSLEHRTIPRSFDRSLHGIITHCLYLNCSVDTRITRLMERVPGITANDMLSLKSYADDVYRKICFTHYPRTVIIDTDQLDADRTADEATLIFNDLLR